MSDLLDRVAEPGLDLLHRVDAALASAGAPADDPVWPLLRRAGALPGEILSHLLGTDPAALTVTGDDVRAESVALSRAVDAVPGPAAWRGHAADEFAAQWSAAAGHLDRITERLTATADHSAELAGWLAGIRRQVAIAVAECLASTEAATVRLADTSTAGSATAGNSTAGSPVGPAAAAIAAHVLGAVLDGVAAAETLRQRWAGRLDEVGYRAAEPVAGAGAPHTIEI